MEILAAALSFPTLWAFASFVAMRIALWGDDHPTHPANMGMLLLTAMVAVPFAAAGSFALYLQLSGS